MTEGHNILQSRNAFLEVNKAIKISDNQGPLGKDFVSVSAIE